MKILAILQNQWFAEPDKVRAIMARATPAHRRRLTAFFLFRGCRTGVLLRQIFSADRCERIVWDNASPLIGGHASAFFPADLTHIRASIKDVSPDVVLAFGKVATDALTQIIHGTTVHEPRLITGPHPVARQSGTIDRLKHMAGVLAAFEIEQEHGMASR